MAGILRSRTLTATAALTLPLWLGSCAPGPVPSAGSGLSAGAAAVEPAEPAAPVPAPLPQPRAPSPLPAETGPRPPQQPATPSGSAQAPGSGTTPVPGAGTGADRPTPSAVPLPSPVPGTSAPPQARPSVQPSTAPPRQQDGAGDVTAYYVLLNDGGAAGVRFGCNDSLVSVRRPVAGAPEPLPAAMNALLDDSTRPAPRLYNALAASTLTFLSGTFDGDTVTVYLAGTLRPGGECDVPRIEAQLLQTAVAAVGAVHAKVYVNSEPLAQALRLK